MSRRLKWGVLGTASITRRRFMPAMLKSRNAEVVALGSRDIDRARAFAGEFGIPRAYGSYEDVLKDPEVEAVYIPLPNHMHAEWTMRAADAGKHVLCEKPMAVDGQEAFQVASHCRERGVTLMEGFMYRLNPRTQKVKEVVVSGMIGEIRTAIVQFGFTINREGNTRLIPGKGAGSLMDVGCYCINFSRYIFGEEPAWVLASQRVDPDIGCDMSTSAVLGFSGDRTALISCSFETYFRSAIEVVGTQGILRAARFFTPPEQGKIGFTVTTDNDQVHEFEFDAVNQFLLEIEHFSECVLEGKPVILDPLVDAVGNGRVIDAVRKSWDTSYRADVAPV